MRTNSVPGTVLVARDTATKETKYEHSIIYFIFAPLTDIRFCHDKECFGECPCTGLLLQVLLQGIFLGVKLLLNRPHFQLYQVLPTCFPKSYIRLHTQQAGKMLCSIHPAQHLNSHTLSFVILMDEEWYLFVLVSTSPNCQ